MCIRKAVSSQLTGVVESPEETAAQPCPSAPGLFREPRVQNCPPIPVAWCSRQTPKRKMQDLQPPWVGRHRARLGPGFSCHPVHLHVGPEASRNTHASELTARPTVCNGSVSVFPLIWSSSTVFFFSILFIVFFFLYPLTNIEKGLNTPVLTKVRSFLQMRTEWKTKS